MSLDYRAGHAPKPSAMYDADSMNSRIHYFLRSVVIALMVYCAFKAYHTLLVTMLDKADAARRHYALFTIKHWAYDHFLSLLSVESKFAPMPNGALGWSSLILFGTMFSGHALGPGGV